MGIASAVNVMQKQALCNAETSFVSYKMKDMRLNFRGLVIMLGAVFKRFVGGVVEMLIY